jgi:hypothetical protein
MLIDIIMPRYVAELNNPTIPTSYAIDMKKESKNLINTIKANLKQRAEEDLELLEAGGMSKKLEKFKEKVRKNHGCKEKKDK